MLTPAFGIFAASYYVIAGLGVNLGYHRVLSHRSLGLAKWLEYTMVLLGLPAGTPLQWAGNHRFHHAHTDTPEDPHSPVHRGFWYAHVGWYIGSGNVLLCILYSIAGPVRMLVDAWMRPRTNQEYNALARDVAEDRFYAWLSKPGPYALGMHAHAAIPAWVTWHYWGLGGLAGFWITLALLYNLGDAIDSVAHLYGSKLEGQRDASRNSQIMGWLILGEGWHANHHRFPWSARHGLLTNQFDWTWQVIRLLEFTGLAHSIRVPNAAELAQAGLTGGMPSCK